MKAKPPGVNPKKIKKYRNRNSFPKIENKGTASEIIKIKQKNKKSPIINKTENEELKTSSELDKIALSLQEDDCHHDEETCLEVCKMLLSFCNNPKKKSEVLDGIKRRGYADDDDIMKLLNGATKDSSDIESEERAQQLMETIQKGKSKYYINTLDKNTPAITCETKHTIGMIDNVKNREALNKQILKVFEESKTRTNDKTKEDLSKERKLRKKTRICWKCSREGTDLWKCGGCRKAW